MSANHSHLKERALRHLAAAMAHEVRNPLNSMAIHAELLSTRLGKLRGGQLGADERDAALRSCEVLAGEIERVDRILEEYLRFAGPEETPRRPIDAQGLIAAAVDRVRPLADQRAVRIDVSGEGLGKWPVDGEELVDALEQIVKNAIEASSKNAAVTISARTTGEHGEIVVRDSGEGIEPTDLLRVFHLGVSNKGRDGIGLAVAKQIVKGHGGSLIAASDGLGRGATFTLRVPLEALDDGDDDE